MYLITERINRSEPSNHDPLAQAFKRHSGMYDVRDALNGRVIVTSSTNLSVLRRYQALHNTKFVLDVPAMQLDTQTMRDILRVATAK